MGGSFRLESVATLLWNTHNSHGPHQTTSAGQTTKGVARAQIEQVLCAAKVNSVGNDIWFKHFEGAFNEPALGDGSTTIPGTNGNHTHGGRHSTPWPHDAAWFNNGTSSGYIGQPTLPGTIHTQAAYSAFSDRYYMPLTQLTWPGADGAFVDLYVSDTRTGTEGTVPQWDDVIRLAWEPKNEHGVNPGGNQYCSVIDSNGYSNAEVGAIFFVFCVNLGQDAIDDGSAFMKYSAIYRWKIDLTGSSVKVESLSGDFTFPSVTGNWNYQYGDSTQIYDAVSNAGGYYTASSSPGSDVLRIFPNSVHPSDNLDPILTWTAAQSKIVHVGGVVRSADTGKTGAHCAGPVSFSDGVSASIIYTKNTGVQNHVFYKDIDQKDTVGFSPNLFFNVSPGDKFQFIVNKKTNSHCDLTSWDPVIEILN